MPDAVSRYGADRLSGRYADIATALGGHAERVERPADLRGALERCLARVAAGQAALCEVATHEEPAMAGHS
jgi:acetolactate synthase-1/2/3 large subunit